ncbi:MAG: UMP kinase [Thermoplasmatota archaeon]
MVISVGGSMLVKDDDDAEYIRELATLLEDLSSGHRFVLITGGGSTARKYIDIGRRMGASEALLDNIGIQATRLNAWTLISALGDLVYPMPVKSMEEALIGISNHVMVVGGGTHPGHTTDTVAALIAERWKADVLINMTNVNGAYNLDPNKESKAERIRMMTSSQLVDLVSSTKSGAGSHSVIDPLASKVLHRAGIRTMIMDGRDLVSVRNSIEDGDFDGTLVVPDDTGGL